MASLVDVEVIEVRPNGVLVRLAGDSRVGFIRRQELSWDQRLDIEIPWPEIGDELTAKILGSDGRFVRLSLRTGEPWEDEQIEERFREEQVVQGQVVQISRYGAFVQLAPGVDALARIASLPVRPNEPLESVLAVGDEVQAVIARIDTEKKQIEINLNERLRQLSLLSSKERHSFQLDLFQSVSPAEERIPLPTNEDPLDLEEENDESELPSGILTTLRRLLVRTSKKHAPRTDGEQRFPESRFQWSYPSLIKLERVLIVEDNDADRREIGRRIAEAFKVEVDCAASGKEALERAAAGPDYDLVLLDVNLPDGSAVEIAHELRELQALLVIVFMSRNPLADENLPGDSPFVLKDQGFQSIQQFIAQILEGKEAQTPDAKGKKPTSTRDFVRHLGMEAFARRTLEETLRPMLHRLRLQTQVSQAIIFRVDSDKKKVSIVSMDPLMKESIQRRILDRLYYSPLQNIVEDEEPYYEVDTQVRYRHPRFRRLYQGLPFRSCLGLPLAVPDLKTYHALFLFDEKRPRFELEDLDNARLAARFFQVAVERATIFDFMQRYEARYARGLLVNSLMHELAIKLNTLDPLVETLPAALKQARKPTKSPEREVGLQAIQDIIEDLQANTQGMKDLVDAYLQMARENWEDVDVNAVVEKVRLQTSKLAEEDQITIRIEAGEVALARTIASRLEQILLNLVLNAIQQIGHQQKTMAKLPKRKADDPDLLRKGQVIIQTRFVDTDRECPIQILVIDTGPGVRYPDQRRIFQLDTTSRKEGHGWGLFLSRNLAEIMHGRLRLVGSVRFIGSAFAVELPLFSSGGA